MYFTMYIYSQISVFFFSQISVFRFKKKSTKRIFTFYISVSFIFLIWNYIFFLWKKTYLIQTIELETER